MRSRHGFTFMEVMLALVVLAISITVLGNMQMSSVFRVDRGRELVDRVFLIKRRLYEQFLRPVMSEKAKIDRLEQPPVKITTQTLPVSKKSSLASLRDQLIVLRADGEWPRAGLPGSITMVSFAYRAPEKEKA